MEVNTTNETRRAYVPAAGHELFLPFYDPLVKVLGGDPTRQVLVDQAALRPGQRVLEIGCGTGSLPLAIKRLHPTVDVIGLDPDPHALARARRKAERMALTIQFDRGFADELPYRRASFDRVFSSFMFHHLPAGEREKTLLEVVRVLKPGGSLHLLDFTGTAGGRRHGWFHVRHEREDNAEDAILTLMTETGFADVMKIHEGALLFGRLGLNYYRAVVRN